METKKSARKSKGTYSDQKRAYNGQNGAHKGQNRAYKGQKVVFKSQTTTIGDYLPDSVTVVDTLEGRPIIQYRGKSIPPRLRTEDNPNPVLQGSRVVAGFVPQKLLPEALRKIRQSYVTPYKEVALMDFYPRIHSIVNSVYSGSKNAWKDLKKQQQFIIDNKDLFSIAVTVVSADSSKKFPSWNADGFRQDVLEILRGDYSFDPYSMIIALVDKVYVGKWKGYKVEKLPNGEEIKHAVESYPGAKTVVFLCKTIPTFVLIYQKLFETAVSKKDAKMFPELNDEKVRNGNQEVLRILRGC